MVVLGKNMHEFGQGKHSVRLYAVRMSREDPALPLPLKGSCKGFDEHSKFAPHKQRKRFFSGQKSKKNVSGLSERGVVCCVVDERGLTDGSEEIVDKRKSL